MAVPRRPLIGEWPCAGAVGVAAVADVPRDNASAARADGTSVVGGENAKTGDCRSWMLQLLLTSPRADEAGSNADVGDEVSNGQLLLQCFANYHEQPAHSRRGMQYNMQGDEEWQLRLAPANGEKNGAALRPLPPALVVAAA